MNITSVLRLFRSRKNLIITLAINILGSGLSQAASNTDLMNLHVTQDGIHRVTYSDLRDAGLDLNGIKKRSIAMVSEGKSIPIRIVGGDDPAIEFLAKGRDSIYSDEMIYTITLDRRKRKSVRNSNPKIPRGESATFYMEEVRYEPQKEFSTNAPSDPWYSGKFLYSGSINSVDMQATIDGYVPNVAPAKVSVGLWGYTTFDEVEYDHHVRLSVNNVQLTGLSESPNLEQFLGRVDHVLAGQTDGNLAGYTALEEGENQIKVELVPISDVPLDVVGIDNWSITYPREFQAKDGRLNFKSAARKFTIKGIDTKDVSIYRESESGKLRRITRVSFKGNCASKKQSRKSTTTRKTGKACTITFPGSGKSDNYYVTTSHSAYKPVQLTPVPELDDIRSGSAEYLVISHADFIGDKLNQLVDYRSSDFSVKVVDVEQIYAQFNDYLFGSDGIQAYIKYAAKKMGTTHVLLVGGDTVDFMNYFERESPAISFLPTIYGDTGLQSYVPLDSKYADLDDDNVPDIAIGRFPIRTVNELEILINKIFLYEDPDKSYARTSLFAADIDDPDSAYSFEADADELIGSLSQSWLDASPKKAYLQTEGLSTARQKLLDTLDEGVDLVSYIGHSDASYWGYLGITHSFLTSTDLVNMKNYGRPTLITQWGCWNTFFPMPTENTMAHEFLLRPAQNGDVTSAPGAVGVVGAATVTIAEAEADLSKILFDILFHADVTLGEAITLAKQEFAITRPEQLDVILGWTVLADPALRISH